ncbi:MAG: hypothetical protein WC654_05100 [Patescibacteria group bacterium]
MVPQGRTVREQLEAWRDAQTEVKRGSALRLAGLSHLYEMIVTEGELTKRVQVSLQSPKIQKKLAHAGIDMETTWVDMGKKAVDQTQDWLPDIKTRKDVVDLFHKYIERIGGSKQLSRIFFDGKDLDCFYLEPPKTSHPGFSTIVAMLRFCIDDVRSGGERSHWTSAELFFMEGQWAVFGRGRLPFPELTGEEEFNAWFTSRVPHEQVDHVAKMLNTALGKDAFSPGLLIGWRKGQIPSKEKFEALMAGIRLGFQEWLPQAFQADVVPALPSQVPVHEPVETQAVAPIGKPPTMAELLAQLVESIAPLVPKLAAAQMDLEQRLNEVTATKSATPANGKSDDPGEVMNGFRFVLTQESFQRADVFNLDEVDDTESLITELARRLALMNSMTPNDRLAVLRRLRHAFDELFIQVRHISAQEEDLPALFLEMRITSGALSGKSLEDIDQ